MTSKIFRSTILVAAIVLLCSLSIIMGFLYEYFDGVQAEQLADELSLAATGTEQNGVEYLKSVESHRFRITWIAADGTVIYDTQADETSMENHADREEIAQALKAGLGRSARYSETLTEVTMYEAKRLSDGTVLRISISRASSAMLVLGMLQPIAIVIAIAIGLSALLANRMAKRIVEPLNRLNLERPLENDAYEELSPLLHRISQQHSEISSQMQQLQRKADEFTQITENMNEGLVVLNKDRRILSINPAARALFGAGADSVGQDFLTVDRSKPLQNTLDTAFGYGTCEIRISRNGREYQLNASRIESEGSIIGTVLLAFDVTEALNAERNRREFSANVSHELKTPLQSIIGGAELLENGLVQQADIPRFIGHIRKEAARLVALVEDIIRLSQLDEGVAIPTEEVELLSLANEVASNLRPAALAKSVTIAVSGESCSITGARRLLYEIVSNLCDNAVKYNVDGGSVTISVKNMGAQAVVSVADTGIGIPAEHHARIFERFYRVDKSHSRQSGGTGLGLSIVKHAVQQQGGKIDLQSAPGKGTTVTVTFPK